MNRTGARWEAKGVRVRSAPQADRLAIYVSASGISLTHIHCRWSLAVATDLLVSGDHWERSYGDLHWGCLVPERAMPWYFLTHDSQVLHGYGVKTGSGSLCFWQIDPDGVSLWMNVSNGGSGVQLGDRELHAATIVAHRGQRSGNPMEAATLLCRKMCGVPRLATSKIYGSNDWYYAYGQNSAQGIIRDAELMSSVAPAKGDRPFTIIDDGWQNKSAFPDMPALTAAIRQRGVRPGLWIRPLPASQETPAGLLLPEERFGARTGRRQNRAYDPTVAEALEAVLSKVREATAWGYELIKHDYTTFDLLGQWGLEMKAQPALPGWNFHDRSRTTAEIIRELYSKIREAAGDRTVLIGCNTMGHLAAGIFEVQRTGDDTSGQQWERTRRMGVNTLAFRLPQHRTFSFLDADCVPITAATPWSCNQQWLDLIARTGTALFVSPEPGTVKDAQRQALRDAFQLLLSTDADAYPLDWQSTTTPGHWKFRDRTGKSVTERKYDWYQDSGSWPYDI
ncbi:MAG TPA: hypothetical protein VG759_02950 [Candidatus Angelobacter sp.]|nr:hypothetical protein [Candidatus Angelobacter sp.]